MTNYSSHCNASRTLAIFLQIIDLLGQDYVKLSQCSPRSPMIGFFVISLVNILLKLSTQNAKHEVEVKKFSLQQWQLQKQPNKLYSVENLLLFKVKQQSLEASRFRS